MPDDDRVIAVGLLTARDIAALGKGFTCLYPIDETPCFGELLLAIDDADRIHRRAHGPKLRQT